MFWLMPTKIVLNRNVELRVKDVKCHKFENARDGHLVAYSTIRLFLLDTVLSKLCCRKLLVEVNKAKEFLSVSSARMSPAPWFLPSDYLAGKKSEETRVKIFKSACSVYKC